jgi:hypothetical protein
MVENINILNLKNQPSLNSEQIRHLAEIFFAITKRALEKDKQRFPNKKEIVVLENLLDLDYQELGDSVEDLRLFYERCYPKMKRALREANVWETPEHAKLYEEKVAKWLLRDDRNSSFDYFVRYFLEKINVSESKYGGQNIGQVMVDYLNKDKDLPGIDSEPPQSKKDHLLSLDQEQVLTHQNMEVIDGLDLEATSLPLIKHNYPTLPSLPKNERLIPSDEIMKNRNRLEAMRLALFEKQEALAKMGLLSGIFKGKKKNNLSKEIDDLQKAILELESKNKISEVRFVVKERSAALDLRVDHSQEEKPNAPVKKLFAFYEKFFMKKLLPEKWRNKLEKQGFLGKLFANACTFNTAIGFALFGGGLALGGASIVGAGMLSGRRLLSGTATGVGSYNLLKLGSKSYAQSHGWDKQLGVAEMKGLSLDQTIKYLAHYEANALLEGKKVDGDLYYNSLLEHFSNILEEGKAAFVDEKSLEFNESAWQNYTLEKIKEIDVELEKALKKKNIKEARLKGAAVLLGITVGSGLFQKAVGHLFNWGEAPASVTENGEVIGGVETGSAETLLAEQEISHFPEVPHDNFDLFSENMVDQTIIPELASENLPVDQGVSPNLIGGEDFYDAPQAAMDSVMEVPQQTAGMLKRLFIENHPLIEKAGGDISVVGDKIKVVFDIKVGGDFELKQQALRRIMMDVFPVAEVMDADGLSFVDTGRIESNVATFTKLLEAKPFHGFDPGLLKDIIKMEGNQLVITDYARLEKISSGVLEVSKQWVPDITSGFVRVAKNTNEKIWESMLTAKLPK